MKIKIKRLNENAQIPAYAHPGDAGMDVVATSVIVTDDYIEYGTGLAFEVPEGYCMLIFPRSSNSKKDLLLANSVGILDSTYRGELKLRFKRCYRVTSKDIDELYHCVNIQGSDERFWIECTKRYDIGDKVGQIVILPYPTIEFDETDSLSETDRGEGGFGSSGK